MHRKKPLWQWIVTFRYFETWENPITKWQISAHLLKYSERVCVCVFKVDLLLWLQSCFFFLLLQLNISHKPTSKTQHLLPGHLDEFTHSIPVKIAHVTSDFNPFLDPLLKSNLPDRKNNCSVDFPSLTNHDRENSEHIAQVWVNSRQGVFSWVWKVFLLNMINAGVRETKRGWDRETGGIIRREQTLVFKHMKPSVAMRKVWMQKSNFYLWWHDHVCHFTSISWLHPFRLVLHVLAPCEAVAMIFLL